MCSISKSHKWTFKFWLTIGLSKVIKLLRIIEFLLKFFLFSVVVSVNVNFSFKHGYNWLGNKIAPFYGWCYYRRFFLKCKFFYRFFILVCYADRNEVKSTELFNFFFPNIMWPNPKNNKHLHYILVFCLIFGYKY